MRQFIIWANTDPIHWRIYGALAGDALNIHLGQATPFFHQGS